MWFYVSAMNWIRRLKPQEAAGSTQLDGTLEQEQWEAGTRSNTPLRRIVCVSIVTFYFYYGWLVFASHDRLCLSGQPMTMFGQTVSSLSRERLRPIFELLKMDFPPSLRNRFHQNYTHGRTSRFPFIRPFESRRETLGSPIQSRRPSRRAWSRRICDTIRPQNKGKSLVLNHSIDDSSTCFALSIRAGMMDAWTSILSSSIRLPIQQGQNLR